MSARYSSSPALRLRIARSRLRAILYCLFCLVTAYALWQVYYRTHPVIFLLVTLFAAALLWRMRRDTAAGVELCWRRGVWTLEQAGAQRAIVPTRRSTAMPWVIYFAYKDLSGGAGHMWLFPDSASAQELRRLRVRLTMLR